MEKILKIWHDRREDLTVVRSIIRSLESILPEWEEFTKEEQDNFMTLAEKNKSKELIAALRAAKRTELEELSLRDLRQLAIRNQIKNYCRLSKDDLIRSIRDAKKRRKYGC